MIKPAAIFDLDGTIRYAKGKIFIEHASDIALYPGVEEKLWELRDTGFLVCAVSNQGGIAFGKKTEQQVVLELKQTFDLFDKRGNPFNIVKVCYHMVGGTVHPFNKRSLLRKPQIGMLALIEYECAAKGVVVDWDNSFFVGDRNEDELCASNADIKFYRADTYFSRDLNLSVEAKMRLITPAIPMIQSRIENIEFNEQDKIDADSNNGTD